MADKISKSTYIIGFIKAFVKKITTIDNNFIYDKVFIDNVHQIVVVKRAPEN